MVLIVNKVLILLGFDKDIKCTILAQDNYRDSIIYIIIALSYLQSYLILLIIYLFISFNYRASSQFNAYNPQIIIFYSRKAFTSYFTLIWGSIANSMSFRSIALLSLPLLLLASYPLNQSISSYSQLAIGVTFGIFLFVLFTKLSSYRAMSCTFIVARRTRPERIYSGASSHVPSARAESSILASTSTRYSYSHLQIQSGS